MAGEITYTSYRKEALDALEDLYFGIVSGQVSETDNESSYLLKTGDSGEGNYYFDTDTLFIDSVHHCIGICTLSPEGYSLAINASDGNCLRLIYNDTDSGPTVYSDFSVTFDGHLILSTSGDGVRIGNTVGSNSFAPLELTNTSDCGLAITTTSTAGAGLAETYIAGFIPNSDGTLKKVGALDWRWTDKDATSGYASWDIHTTAATAGVTADYFGLAVWAKHGAAFFPAAVTSSYAPGLNILKINGSLQVRNGASGINLVYSETATSASSILSIGDSGGIRIKTDSGLTVTDIAFAINTYSGGYADRMVVLGNGNIGIGISPSVKLDILGLVNTNIVNIRTSDGVKCNIGVNSDETGFLTLLDGDGDIGVQLNTQSGNYSYVMTNFGIQQITPKADLHINNQLTIGEPASGYCEFAKNAYFSSGWKYIQTDQACLIEFDNAGNIKLCTAVSGTADDVVTFSVRLQIYNDTGNISIGTASTPNSKLSVGSAGHSDYAIYGYSSIGGVKGEGVDEAGVVGASTDGVGVNGISTHYYGVYGYRTDGAGPSIGANGQIYATGGRKPANYIHAENVTDNTIFDALDESIPNTDDTMVVHGALEDAGYGIILICSYALRYNSTHIVIYGTAYDKYASIPYYYIYTIGIPDGGASSHLFVSISW
jgi:hypothetical protein